MYVYEDKVYFLTLVDACMVHMCMQLYIRTNKEGHILGVDIETKTQVEQ
jgi:hypothetical protein